MVFCIFLDSYSFYIIVLCLLCPSTSHQQNSRLEQQINCPFPCEGSSPSLGLGFICCSFDLALQLRYSFQVTDTQELTFLSGLLHAIVDRVSKLQHPQLVLELLGDFPGVAVATTQNMSIFSQQQV